MVRVIPVTTVMRGKCVGVSMDWTERTHLEHAPQLLGPPSVWHGASQLGHARGHQAGFDVCSHTAEQAELRGRTQPREQARLSSCTCEARCPSGWVRDPCANASLHPHASPPPPTS